jgi:hypothetical protein
MRRHFRKAARAAFAQARGRVYVLLILNRGDGAYYKSIYQTSKAAGSVAGQLAE